MDSTFYIDFIRSVHLIGVVIGFGLALLADMFAIRAFSGPVSQRDIAVLHRLHIGVSIGLVLLWASGLALIQVRTGFELANFTPKLIAKIAVVALLTANAFVISTYALPMLERIRATGFCATTLHNRLELASVAGVSLACWISAFALGVFSQLKPMGFADIGAALGWVFIAVTGSALAVAYLAPVLARGVANLSGRPVRQPVWARRLARA